MGRVLSPLSKVILPPFWEFTRQYFKSHQLRTELVRDLWSDPKCAINDAAKLIPLVLRTAQKGTGRGAAARALRRGRAIFQEHSPGEYVSQSVCFPGGGSSQSPFPGFLRAPLHDPASGIDCLRRTGLKC